MEIYIQIYMRIYTYVYNYKSIYIYIGYGKNVNKKKLIHNVL